MRAAITRPRAVLLALIFSAAAAWVAVGASTSTCHNAAARPGEQIFQPSAIVLRPWFGRHNVYGIFIVPDEYQEPKYTITATVSAGDAVLELTGTDIELMPTPGLPMRPGEHALDAQVQSRVAAWLLATGRFGDLRAACNWQLRVAPAQPPQRGAQLQ
jgi:hypothetical protein